MGIQRFQRRQSPGLIAPRLIALDWRPVVRGIVADLAAGLPLPSIACGFHQAIAEMVAALGHTLQLKTVAEGIETAEQAEKIKSWGCHYAQGFYYSPAVPSSDFIAWVKHYRARLAG